MEQIGIGSFGKVFKVSDKQTRTIYAAKISRTTMKEEEKQTLSNLIREVSIISKLNHPSVLQFIYFDRCNFKGKPKPVIITEFASNGSLEDYISLNRQLNNDDRFNYTHKIIIIYGIASGMSYLHSHNIIHRDLKPANILLDDYLNPKIADFGLSKIFDENQTNKSTLDMIGTPCYMSPEIFEKYEYSKSSDVYAFGMILYELLTNEKLYDQLNTNQIFDLLKDGYRPEFKSSIPSSYKNLIEKCWAQNPSERPTFDEICQLLKNDPGFVTNLVDINDYQNYIDYIEKSKVSFEENKKIISINEFIKDQSKLFKKTFLKTDSKIEMSSCLFPSDEFNKLDEKCQSFVLEAENDPLKQYIVAKCLIEGQENFPQNSEIAIIYFEKAIDGGNIDAVKEYSNLLIKGESLPQDLEKAKSILEKVIEEQDETVLFLYGKILKKEKKFEEALKYFKKSSIAGNSEAMYECGKMIMKGEGCEQNDELANEYFKLSEMNGHEISEKYLTKQDNENEMNEANNINEIFYKTINQIKKEENQINKKSFIDICQKAADNGNADAMYEYAKILDKGDGIPINKEKASTYYLNAANKGHIESIFRYAQMLDEGDDVPMNKEIACQYYKIAADQGHSYSMYKYAQMAEKGEGTVISKKVAFEYYKMGADKEQIECIYPTALMLNEGIGVNKDKEEAFKYFKIGYDKGLANCISYYGLFLYNGYGNVDKKEAVKYIKMAADKGDAPSMNLYAVFLDRGVDVPYDKNESLRYSKMSADNGFPYGMYNYAAALKSGDGIPVDLKEAARYYKKAADHGVVEAMFMYGMMVEQGDGIPVDLKEAACYYKMAADHGDKTSQMKYIALCSSGNGPQTDYSESLKYLKNLIGITDTNEYAYDNDQKEEQSNNNEEIQTKNTEEDQSNNKEEIQTKNDEEDQSNNKNEKPLIKVKENDESPKVSPIPAIPTDLFNNLDESIQLQIYESKDDPEKLFSISQLFFKGEQNLLRDYAIGVNILEQLIKGGCKKAAVLYIKMLIKDDIITHDIEKAKIYLNDKISKDDASYFYLSGLINIWQRKYKEALSNFEIGMNKGDYESMFEYGKMLYKGKRCEKNVELATQYFNQLRSIGFNQVDEFLMKQKRKENEYKENEIYYKATAPQDYNDIEKVYNFAMKEYNGYNTTRDKYNSFKNFRIAAEKGHIDSMAKCAKMHIFDEIGRNISIDEILNYVKTAVKEGNSDAMYVYAHMLKNGIGVSTDIDESIRYYKMAIEKGNDGAMTDYGEILQNGEIVEKDINEAIRLYKIAIDKGNPVAMYNFGLLYEYGYGVKKDKPEAARLYRMSGKKNCFDAYNQLGIMLEKGDGIPINKVEAAKVFNEAAVYGSVPEAMLNYANMLNMGNGIPIDKVEALSFYENAALYGIVDAMVNAGRLLNDGDGVPMDKNKAQSYFKKAADLGHPGAKLLLNGLNCSIQ